MPEKRLLVEGKFDKYVIEELIKSSSQATTNPEISPHPTKNISGPNDDEEGISALLRALPVNIKNADSDDILGIVVDADLSERGRWQRIRDTLIKVGYQELPDTFPDGLIVPGNDVLPRFGLWIMPDNKEEGVIENFIRRIIHEHDKLQPEIDSTLNSLRDNGLQLFSDIHRPKAFIRTWLAWQESPEMSFGVAISKKVLVTDNELGLRFINWLNNLFTV
jgi:hypothetical protein